MSSPPSAALLFIPGGGQPVQWRFLKTVIMFVLAAMRWVFRLGWIAYVWPILDAAMFKPNR